MSIWADMTLQTLHVAKSQLRKFIKVHALHSHYWAVYFLSLSSIQQKWYRSKGLLIDAYVQSSVAVKIGNDMLVVGVPKRLGKFKFLEEMTKTLQYHVPT